MAFLVAEEIGLKCDECQGRIAGTQKYWCWRWQNVTVRMHLNCFARWGLRAVKDYQRIGDQG